MFALCEGMKWAHLPWEGGLYDQHPDLLAGFRYMFAVRAEKEEQERKKQEAEQKRASRGKGGVAGQRRR